MIEHVTEANLSVWLSAYRQSRGGESYEETESEAMFLVSAQFGGSYLLHTSGALGHVWIGIQNATARATNHGHAFDTVELALRAAMRRWPGALYYAADTMEWMLWMAERTERFKAYGHTRIEFFSEDWKPPTS